ncbi:hypothetical protein KGQ25_01635 [Patescibacteria group bacterium]|nr:hypothetical protein [Patescibacteria group bacterium]
MKSNAMIQTATALGTLVLAVLVLNPFRIWMPTMMAMALLAALFLAFCVFAVFVVREKAADERDEQHRTFAGRAAFLMGASLLVIAILIEDLKHSLDPWLVIVLIGMIVAKLAARFYSDYRL